MSSSTDAPRPVAPVVTAPPTRRRWIPTLGDAFVGSLMLLLGLATPHLFGDLLFDTTHTVLTVFSAVIAVWRTRFPVLVSALLSVTALAITIILPVPTLIVVFDACLVAWTVSSRFNPPWRWPLIGAGYLLCLVSLAFISLRLGEQLSFSRFAILLTWAWLFLTVAVLGGDRRRAARSRAEATVERLALLESQQETLEELAVNRERTRIAHEVHDLLGHTLTAVAAQADGARHILHRDPARAEEALSTIARISRDGVSEVRMLVDLLRDPEKTALPFGQPGRTTSDAPVQEGIPVKTPPLGPPAPEEGPPAPEEGPPAPTGPLLVSSSSSSGASLCALPFPLCLVDLAHTCGVSTEIVLDLSDGCEPPATIRDALRAITREALTNAVRHGGEGTIRFALTCQRGVLSLTVSNPLPAPSPVPKARQGLGLASMAARARAIGASFHAGEEDTMWRVTVEVHQ